MKKHILAIIAFLIPVIAQADGVGTFSTGYRMGNLTKFSVKGLVFKSGEGQMLMGRQSSVYQIRDSKGRKITINPWYFSSTDKTIQEQLAQHVGEYVVLKYKQSHIKMPNVDTDYEITEVSKPTRKFDEVCVAKKYHKGMKSGGSRVGRIVKASSKGALFNSYELIIQLGDAGNQFKNMSISKDKELFNCAVRALKSARPVKVTYSQSLINLDIINRNTSYDIIKIEPKPSDDI